MGLGPYTLHYNELTDCYRILLDEQHVLSYLSLKHAVTDMCWLYTSMAQCAAT